MKQFEKQMCSRLFVEKVSDVFTNKYWFISMEVEDTLKAEEEYSQCRDRVRMWLSSKK